MVLIFFLFALFIPVNLYAERAPVLPAVPGSTFTADGANYYINAEDCTYTSSVENVVDTTAHGGSYLQAVAGANWRNAIVRCRGNFTNASYYVGVARRVHDATKELIAVETSTPAFIVAHSAWTALGQKSEFGFTNAAGGISYLQTGVTFTNGGATRTNSGTLKTIALNGVQDVYFRLLPGVQVSRFVLSADSNTDPATVGTGGGAPSVNLTILKCTASCNTEAAFANANTITTLSSWVNSYKVIWEDSTPDKIHILAHVTDSSVSASCATANNSCFWSDDQVEWKFRPDTTGVKDTDSYYIAANARSAGPTTWRANFPAGVFTASTAFTVTPQFISASGGYKLLITIESPFTLSAGQLINFNALVAFQDATSGFTVAFGSDTENWAAFGTAQISATEVPGGAPDTTAPTVDAATFANVGSTGMYVLAAIGAESSTPVTCRVEYVPSAGGSAIQTAFEPCSPSATYQKFISGLSSGTSYDAFVRACDSVGNCRDGDASSQSTNNEPPPPVSADRCVATTGDDGDTGAFPSNCWLTLQKAADTAAAGETVYILAGTYSGQVNITRSGTVGNPITFVGACTNDAANCSDSDPWLGIQRGDTDVSGSWEVYDAANGIYRKNLGFKMGHMVDVSGGVSRQLWRIADVYMNGSTAGVCSISTTGLGHMAITPTRDCGGSSSAIKYWDGVEAWVGYIAPYTYIRYRNKDDVNAKTLRASGFVQTNFTPTAASCSILMNGASYWVIKNLSIRGGQQGLCLRNVSNVTVEYNHFAGSQRRVYAHGTSSNVTIQNNKFEGSYLGTIAYEAAGGNPWDIDPSFPERRLVQSKLYAGVDKFIVGESSGIDASVWFGTIGSGGTQQANLVKSNTFSKVGVGPMTVGATNGLKIHDNTIDRCFAQCIYAPDTPNANMEILGNTVSRCGEYCMRFDIAGGAGVGPWFIGFNKSWLPFNERHHLFPNYEGTSAVIWYYHNTHTGGLECVEGSATNRIRHLNNLYDCNVGFGSGANFEAFGYNTSQNAMGSTGCAATANSCNKVHGSATWTHNSSQPDFILPDGHTAINAGVNLSQCFTLNVQYCPTLPRAGVGYFLGSAPDAGAVEKQ